MKKKRNSSTKTAKALDSQNWESESTVGSPSASAEGTGGSTSSPSTPGGPPAPQGGGCGGGGGCECDCDDEQGGQTSCAAGETTNPSTGSAAAGTPELSQGGGGGSNMDLGQGLQYSGDGSGAGGSDYGNNWVNSNQPRLTFDGSDVHLESGPTNTIVFQNTGDGYQALYFVRDVLTHDEGTGKYTVTSTDGSQMLFSKDGVLEFMKDAYGNEAIYTYDEFDGTLISVVTGTGADTLAYFYLYEDGRLKSVLMRVGGLEPVSDYRRTIYFYAPSGDLGKVVLDEYNGSVWSEIETSYYRYHETGDKKLWFVLNDHAYKQMRSATPPDRPPGVPPWPDSADPVDLAQYADVEYPLYDDEGRVARTRTNGGKYTYDFAYEESTHSGSTADVWTSKTIVRNPDGSVHTFYYNSALSLVLQTVAEPQPGGGVRRWHPVCQRFDHKNRLIVSAASSAIASVDESDPVLFTLKPSEGPIQVFGYDKKGNKVLEGVKQGAMGSLVKLREFTYQARTVAGQTIYVQKTVTEYREATDTTASDPVTTSFKYTWHKRGEDDTFQIETMTTKLPKVPGSENGDGKTGTEKVTYDQYGLVTEQVDAMGTKTVHSYYVDKGALKQTIEDAGTGRLNLTTDYEVDPLGRTVRMLGPEHPISLDGVKTLIRRAQWTQYFDADDEVRTIQGYVKTEGGSAVTVNPVQIARSFAVDPQVIGGRMTEAIAAVYAGSGVPPETTVFTQAAYVRWSTQHFSRENQETHSRRYHLIPAPAEGLGSSPANYAQTGYAYDSAGRLFQVTSPGGTIQRTVFNVMGWQTQSLTGTSEGNLVVTALQEYDGGAEEGDGNLTKVTRKADDSAGNDRVKNFDYDWRNRRTVSSASDGTRTILSVNAYDNRGNVTQVDEYHTEIAAGNLLNRAQSFFDGRNRLYRTKRYGVDITDGGALKPVLTGEKYYDQAGRTVRSTPAGKVGFRVTRYDAIGRALKQFQAYGGTLNPANPGSLSGATVIEQGEFAYDGAGNAISTTVRQRFDDATGTGELKNPSAQPKARVSYVAGYPDALGRPIATADYGTNGGAAWTPPDTIPSRSDTVLVSSSMYDAAGNLTEDTDPMGTVTTQEFDQAGRRVKTVENWFAAGAAAPDINKTTRFEYNLDGNVTKLIAENPTTGPQVTEWIYGVTSAQGSKLASNGLVYQKVYPDSTETADRVTYTWDRQGQTITMQDQAGTTHDYAFDKFGRVTEDAVTAFGTGIDTAVKKITRSYEVRGMLEQAGSWGTGSTPLNEVRFTYNPYSQLAQDWQAHSGPVDPGTLKVEYSHADGSDNTVRPTSLTYPDGTTTITTAYDGTAADALSRPEALQEGSATLCSYRYLGSNVVIGVKYDVAGNVGLTFRDGGAGDAGDPYTGLDRFGRLIETLWKKGAADRVRSQYGRNRFGGIVWRRDDQAQAQGVSTEDNHYSYDGLYQVKERQRGNLTGTPPNYTGIDNLQQKEDWTYDATGNWTRYRNPSPIPANTQTRTQNRANEITQITASVGQVNPAFDPAGNMTTLPRQPGLSTGQYTLKWDAWNRLVSVKDGSMTVAHHTYDGLTRRITKTNATETRHYCYSTEWQVLEERLEGPGFAVDRQYTWGLRDRWDLLRRKRSVTGSLDEAFYVLCDYLDPVTIVDGSGAVAERYAYDAFGNARILAPDYTSRSASDFDWNFLFHAEFLDRDTHLYNYGHRYYSPNLGRWLSQDPIEEDGGLNLYAFVHNGGINAVDFLGLDDIKWRSQRPPGPPWPTPGPPAPRRPTPKPQSHPTPGPCLHQPDPGPIGEHMDEPAHCFNDGWLQHCVNSCRLKIRTGIFDWMVQLCAQINGHDLPGDPRRDEGDVAANAQGIANAHQLGDHRELSENCVTMCTNQFQEKRLQECCIYSWTLTKDDPHCCPKLGSLLA
jgi:RHS repeat-associated protein